MTPVRAMLEILRRHQVDLVVLTGFLKKVGPETLAAFRRRMINIHPSLLPRYAGRGMYGLCVHEAVLAAGDTPKTLADRVLKVEHELLVETVGKIALDSRP